MELGNLGLNVLPPPNASDITFHADFVCTPEGASELAPPGGVSDIVARKLPKMGIPDSVARQIDRAGNVKSLGFYNEFGQLYKRIDVSGKPHFIPGRGRTLPHVSEFSWNPGGSYEGWGFRTIKPRPTTYWEDLLVRYYRSW